MYRIAVVEDEEQYRDEVCQYIQKYEEEHKLEFLVTTYADGQEIVDDEDAHYDIIFFDIEMAQLNGMDAAKVIRGHDADVVMGLYHQYGAVRHRRLRSGRIGFCLETD